MTLKLSFHYILLYFACAACMGWAASCSSDSSDIRDVSKGTEVAFDVKEFTRAAATTSLDHFAVYGDMKSTKNTAQDPIVIFDKTLVEHSDGNWTYEGTQYWFPDYEHSFVAISPLSVLEAGGNPLYSDSQLSFTYTLPSSDGETVNEKDVVDIVAATHRRAHDESSPASPVALRFSHLLSQINFSVELTEPATRSEERYKIHKLELSGFGNSATIKIKPAPRQDNPQTNDSEIEIVTAKADGSLTISFDEPLEVENGAAPINMLAGNNAIILLPQTFAANEKVEVRLTYSTDNEDEPKEVSTDLSGFKWESGKVYNYKIKLELEEPKEVNMVINNATIDPWLLINDHDEVNAR